MASRQAGSNLLRLVCWIWFGVYRDPYVLILDRAWRIVHQPYHYTVACSHLCRSPVEDGRLIVFMPFKLGVHLVKGVNAEVDRAADELSRL